MNKKDLINFIQLIGSIFSITGVSLLWFQYKIDWGGLLVLIFEVLLGLAILTFSWAITQHIINKKYINYKREFLIGIRIIQILIIGFIIILYFILASNIHSGIVELINTTMPNNGS